MAGRIIYKDINELEQKQVLGGNEKLPVSENEYITPEQITQGAQEQINEINEELARKYVKPAEGIPSEDMTPAVQQSLEKANSAYQRPGTGIPKTDLYTTVQRSLNLADSSYQKPASGIPKSDLNSSVQASLDKAGSAVQPNDIADFVTKSVDDLVNYYLKADTYTKSEVQTLIAAIKQFTYELVAVLPTASASTMNKIYLVPSPNSQTENIKDEYITIESNGDYYWEQIGSTAIDLSGYVTTVALNEKLADYALSSAIPTALSQLTADSTHRLVTDTEKSTWSGKQDAIADLSDIRAGADAGATAYQKPSDGIPSTDMASAVVTSLGKADSAYQKPSGGIPKTDLDSGVKASLDLADSANERAYDSQTPDGLGYKVLKKNQSFASQVTDTNTIYEIRYDYELDDDFTMPSGCILKFNGGSISGAYTLEFDNTLLAGEIKCLCLIDGSISNEEVYISWFNTSTVAALRNVMSCICSSDNLMPLYVDKNITGDNDPITLHHLTLRGCGEGITVTDSFKFLITNDVDVEDLTFTAGAALDSLFYCSNSVRARRITVNGAGYLNTPIYIYNTTVAVSIDIQDCEFYAFNRIAIRGYCKSQGAIIANNIIRDCGNYAEGSVGGVTLGYDSAFYRNDDAVIRDNIIKNVKCVFSSVHDTREAHGVIVYGDRALISHNTVQNITSDTESGNGGYDVEAIYTKGSYNVIDSNYINDAVGGNSDGAITIKGTGGGNKVLNNTIISPNGPSIYAQLDYTTIRGNSINYSFSIAIRLAGSSDKNTYGAVLDGNVLTYTGTAAATAQIQGINLYYCPETLICNNQFRGMNTPIRFSANSYGTRIVENYFFLQNVSLQNVSDGVRYIDTTNADGMIFVENNFFHFVGVNFSAWYFIQSGKVTFRRNRIWFKDYTDANSNVTHCAATRLFRGTGIRIDDCDFTIDYTTGLTLSNASNPAGAFRNNTFRATAFPTMSTEATYGNRLETDSYVGSTRPTVLNTGAMFFDTTLGRPVWWDGSSWVDAMPNAAISLTSGSKKLWAGTQAEYDLLTPSNDTLYFIKSN